MVLILLVTPHKYVPGKEICPIYRNIEVSMSNILRVALNSVWVWSSILSSRGVRPFYILIAPDDYILLFACLSLSLSPLLFLPVSPLHSRGEGTIPSERHRSDPPPSTLTDYFLPFCLLLPALLFASRCPRVGKIGKIPLGYTAKYPR